MVVFMGLFHFMDIHIVAISLGLGFDALLCFLSQSILGMGLPVFGRQGSCFYVFGYLLFVTDLLLI